MEFCGNINFVEEAHQNFMLNVVKNMDGVIDSSS